MVPGNLARCIFFCPIGNLDFRSRLCPPCPRSRPCQQTRGLVNKHTLSIVEGRTLSNQHSNHERRRGQFEPHAFRPRPPPPPLLPLILLLLVLMTPHPPPPLRRAPTCTLAAGRIAAHSLSVTPTSARQARPTRRPSNAYLLSSLCPRRAAASPFFFVPPSHFLI